MIRVYVEIHRGIMGVETRGLSGTESEVAEHLAHWKRLYGDENVRVVSTDGVEVEG